MNFDKTSPNNRNTKKFPATQQKNQPNCAGKLSNRQNCSKPCNPRYRLLLRNNHLLFLKTLLIARTGSGMAALAGKRRHLFC